MSNSFLETISTSLILASQSKQRLALLKSIGVNPNRIIFPEIDESIRKLEKPRDYVLRVSKEKAEKVHSLFPNNLILASDTIVVRGNRILDKTEDEKLAFKSLNMLSGNWHKVFTNVTLIKNSKVYNKLVFTRVLFKRLSNFEIENFLLTNEWRGKAGSYAIQGHSGAFIVKIKGSYSNVVGLPLYETLSLLRGVG
mgnify:CR=1 FL=1